MVAPSTSTTSEATASTTSEETADLAKALESLEAKQTAASEPVQQPAAEPRRHLLQGVTARRALFVALGGLLVAGVVTATGFHADTAGRGNPGYNPGDRASVVFSSAHRGDCLTWPTNAPDQPSFAQCNDNHLFEVVESVDMRNFQQPCQLAVQHYLGSHYDPDGKFTVGVLWPGDAAATQPAQRHLLCGLQLLGPDNQPIPFKGNVIDIDQSKVWTPGRCLGIEPSTNQPTDNPVDCAAPHAVEVTGAVNLAEKFRGPRPTESDQDAFIKGECTRIADAYLAPTALPATGLALNYSTVPLASWLAGSRQVSCGIGAPRGDHGWATLTGSAKGGLLIDGQAPTAVGAPSPVPPPPEPVVQQVIASPSPRPAHIPSAASATPSPSPSASPGPPPEAIPGPAPEAIASPTTEAPAVLEVPGLPPIPLPDGSRVR